MSEVKVTMEDDLQERIDCCTSELLERFTDYLIDNPDVEDLDNIYQTCLCDAVHEIVDSNTPIYYYNIDSLYYLYSNECEDAYNDAGCYTEQPDNYKQVAIYFLLESKTWNYYHETIEYEIWEHYQDRMISYFNCRSTLEDDTKSAMIEKYFEMELWKN